MHEVETASMIKKIYTEILYMKEELNEIKSAIIQEDKPEEDEIKAFKEGKKEISSGKLKSWDAVNERFGICI